MQCLGEPVYHVYYADDELSSRHRSLLSKLASVSQLVRSGFRPHTLRNNATKSPGRANLHFLVAQNDPECKIITIILHSGSVTQPTKLLP